jgi:hypothetical protein
VEQEAYDLLCHAQSLLGNHAPTADLPHVFRLALEALVVQLERRRLATSGAGARRISGRVKREVSARDGGQCTFVSESGHHCEARANLELDHIEPVARGGKSVASNLRLRCRAHNQLAADEAFGAGFMHGRRKGAARPTAPAQPERRREPEREGGPGHGREPERGGEPDAEAEARVRLPGA